MKPKIKTLLKSFLMELVLYGAVVIGYFFLVLHFLGDWLYHLYQNDRKTYALMALVLIVGQGFVLEIITRGLLRFIRYGGEE